MLVEHRATAGVQLEKKFAVLTVNGETVESIFVFVSSSTLDVGALERAALVEGVTVAWPTHALVPASSEPPARDRLALRHAVTSVITTTPHVT